jgi:DNA-binding response OmpR family regulator
MHLTVVLAVGLEPSLIATQSRAWKSAGYIVESAGSIRAAIGHFRDGDFDLVLLGNSISVENRERLTFLIRATGAQTPVILMKNRSTDLDSFADATLKNDSSEILTGLGELLEKAQKREAMEGTILYGNGCKRAAAQH